MSDARDRRVLARRWACAARCRLHPLLIALAFGLGAGPPASAQPAPTRTRYVVDVDPAGSGAIEASVTVGCSAGEEQIDLLWPRWRLGRYRLRDFTVGVTAIHAIADDGRALEVGVQADGRWRVRAAGATAITVRYALPSEPLSHRTRHLGDSHAFLSLATVVPYVDGRLDEPVAIRFRAPAGWAIATSLRSLDGEDATFTADDYDGLIACPVELGLHACRSFVVDGVLHDWVVWPPEAADGLDALDRFESLFGNAMHTVGTLYGGVPFRRYLVILHVGPELYGGTEYPTGCVIQSPPEFLSPAYDGGYSLLDLVTHEVLHAWNPFRARPVAFTERRFRDAYATDLLWLVEGTTSYLTSLVLAEAGFGEWSAFGMLGQYLEGDTPNAAGGRSLAAISEQVWATSVGDWAEGDPDMDQVYDRGFLVSFCLDVALLRASGGRVSIRELLARLDRRFGDGTGYRTEDLQDLIEELTGTRLQSFFDRYVLGTEPPPVDDTLRALGLYAFTDTIVDPETIGGTVPQTPATSTSDEVEQRLLRDPGGTVRRTFVIPANHDDEQRLLRAAWMRSASAADPLTVSDDGG